MHTIEGQHSADAEVFFNAIMYCVQMEKFNENGNLSIKGEGELPIQYQDRIQEQTVLMYALHV